jgi:hypothetical protein
MLELRSPCTVLYNILAPGYWEMLETGGKWLKKVQVLEKKEGMTLPCFSDNTVKKNH